MPSGGYGPGTGEDHNAIRDALTDDVVQRYGLEVEWVNAFVAARIAGATTKQAASAAYEEWDL